MTSARTSSSLVLNPTVIHCAVLRAALLEVVTPGSSATQLHSLWKHRESSEYVYGRRL